MEAIKTLKGKNQTLEIFADENPESPRTWDNLAKMIFFGKQEHIGDKHNVELEGGFNDRFDFMLRGADQVRKQLKDVVICKPVHIYDHSGISISTSFTYPFNCQWDSGTIGFAVVTKADIREAYSTKRITKKHIEQADKILENEIEVLNQYLTGDVYGFKLLDKKGIEVDSCWGFYGSDFKMNGMLDYVDGEFLELV